MDFKKIILVTTGQPSTNPRLVKEADILSAKGYKVEVLYQYWADWACKTDQNLLKNKQWSYRLLCGTPKHKTYLYYFSRFFSKLAIIWFSKVSRSIWAAEQGIYRANFFLQLVKKRYKADLYIAHTLGALPAVVKLAAYHKSKCGFDAEDFHRFESTSDTESLDFKIAKTIEDYYIPRLNYLTTASPLISIEYKKLYPQHQPITINNVFSKKYSLEPTEILRPELNLVWFSQTIGSGRGLEQVLEALELLDNENITLMLIGQINKKTFDTFQQIAPKQFNRVKIEPPVPENELFNTLRRFDIGLALEVAEPYNRTICLTNKIFTYIICGLAVIASETSAQKFFFNQHPTIGQIYPIGDIEKLANIIEYYWLNREALFTARRQSYLLGNNELNWEIEGQNLAQIVKNTIFGD